MTERVSAELLGTLYIRKQAGCYVIGDSFRVYVTTKPRWLARVMASLLLQWQWEDARD